MYHLMALLSLILLLVLLRSYSYSIKQSIENQKIPSSSPQTHTSNLYYYYYTALEFASFTSYPRKKPSFFHQNQSIIISTYLDIIQTIPRNKPHYADHHCPHRYVVKRLHRIIIHHFEKSISTRILTFISAQLSRNFFLYPSQLKKYRFISSFCYNSTSRWQRSVPTPRHFLLHNTTNKTISHHLTLSSVK